MARRFPHLLAILTACSTMLAGISLFAVPLPSTPGAAASLSSAPVDADDAADPRCENAGKELEEKENQQEEVETRIHLWADATVSLQVKARLTGAANPDVCPAARRFSAPALPIRGPPLRG
jgi:hypothetical protein